MRLAIKLAYDGTRFHGSQAQPSVRTVHGEVARALAALGEPDAQLRWAGRTDAGVSAAGNVVAFDTALDPEKLLPALTFHMEDAWAWAVAEVPPAFEPRHARERWYRYHLRSDLDADALREAMQPFVGEHDFSAFARVEPDVNPVRTVRSVDARREGPFLVVDVRGESFLWNQVRRMVEAGRRAAALELPSGAIARALADARPADLGTAPPEPLVLMDVAYADVRFREGDRARLFERLRRRVHERELDLAVLRDVWGA